MFTREALIELFAAMRERGELEAVRHDPSWVVTCDIADNKRRNDLLGWRHVDDDIDELGAIIRDETEPDETVTRTSGDAWTATVRNPVKFAHAVAGRFERVDWVDFRWTIRFTRGDEVRTAEDHGKLETVRSIWMGSASTAHGQELRPLADELRRLRHRGQPGRLFTLDELHAREPQRWTCGQTPRIPLESCLLCQSTDLDVEWGGGWYGYDGRCRGCGATLRVEGQSFRASPPDLSHLHGQEEPD